MRAEFFACVLLTVLVTGCNATTDGPRTIANSANDNQTGLSWRGCLDKSYAAQAPLTADKSLAAEMAFVSCKSEEDAFVAHGFRTVGPARTLQTMAEFKPVLKRRLIESH